jgi:ectoine hydroxylase-related dioxygenase (phytanoyl-CoA dioxygenase family)
MNIQDIRNNLNSSGYVVIPNVLNEQEINYSLELFKKWQKTIPNHDYNHNVIHSHGIYKYYNAGHARHAWYIRTRPNVINIFKQLWNCDELVVSFDGSCYIPKNNLKKDKHWTHTDQAPNNIGFSCVQGFVSLTNNKEKTLVVYEGSHLYHQSYFKEKNINSNSNWQIIDEKTIRDMEPQKKILHVPPGALVLWDSRTFHQNRYGPQNEEERIVQYVCYFPKKHENNKSYITEKRLKYFNELRTTTHWPYPIKVISKQPMTYGDNSKIIDYDNLEKPYLDDLKEDIMKLII